MNLMLFIQLFLFVSCLGSPKEMKVLGKKIPYSLDEPSTKFIMGWELTEISGLSMDGDKNIACVQDEDGVIFIYDPLKKEVVERIKFGKPGDYEGVEKVGNSYFVLESNGNLTKVEKLESGIEAKSIETPMSHKNDMEGMGFERGSLTLATKGKGYIGNNEKKGKGIYAFDPGREMLEKDPKYWLSSKKINKFFEKQGEKKWDGSIGISGIAFHPVEKLSYLISSEGKFLIVMNLQGSILSFAKLPRKIFKQPEGICFSKDGTMFISNEGREGAGNILKFQYEIP